MRIQHVFLCLIFSLALSACTTNLYFVRHAEKADASPNTALSTAGHQRAEDLRDFMEARSIDNIYTSNYLRTQQTAQPTIDALNITPVIYQQPAQFQELIDQLKAHRDNRSVLVVHHSNTVPVLIDELMEASQGIVIPESDYDNIYHIKIKRTNGESRVLQHFTYGQITN